MILCLNSVITYILTKRRRTGRLVRGDWPTARGKQVTLEDVTAAKSVNSKQTYKLITFALCYLGVFFIITIT